MEDSTIGSAPVIEMHGVEKRYDERVVLHGLELSVPSGEVFALLGPNGAGKTTAVEILEGYRGADAGEVRVLGVDPAVAGAALRARIGIVLQQTTSFERSTVRETVEMFAALFPSPMSVEAAIGLVGLTDCADQIADTMSGGQRRRLDVACGLVGRPEVLFLDEPTTGLDPEARRAMWQIIRDLRAEGATVLLTTHYLEEAEALADRIGVLLDGRLRDVAEPSRIGGRDSAPATVRFVPAPDAVAAFTEWDHDGDAVSTTSTSPSQLIAELVAAHGELRELSVSRPTLESTYLEMVGRSESGT